MAEQVEPVTRKVALKVIDFGIAKATQGKLTDETLFTRFEQFSGMAVHRSLQQAALSWKPPAKSNFLAAAAIFLPASIHTPSPRCRGKACGAPPGEG
jgi:hypothetical protein